MQVGRQPWSDPELARDRQSAIERFRAERTSEPLDVYLAHYRRAYEVFSQMLNASADLVEMVECAEYLLLDSERQELTRYIASPPLSADDLKTLANCTLAPGALRRNPEAIADVTGYIGAALDRERFPWVQERRAPTDAERHAALVATAALFATRKTETHRRNTGRDLEVRLKEFLTGLGLDEVERNPIRNSSQGPQVGQFCGETDVVGGKADVVVRLSDGRLMPIECKISNSETNSCKRLIHDCGEKAQTWVTKLGPANCVPVAVLSGVYSMGNLRKAQDMGLTLVWAHDLSPLAGIAE